MIPFSSLWILMALTMIFGLVHGACCMTLRAITEVYEQEYFVQNNKLREAKWNAIDCDSKNPQYLCSMLSSIKSAEDVQPHMRTGPSGGHEIVELVVPLLADPRENATLSCRYNMGSDRLYSAKWFKDEAEIFRYMPGEKPAGLPFPVVGVRLARPPRCSPVTCDLELSNLMPNSAGIYRCEVSTEAPTFRIVHKSSNMTIAALPRRDPRIEGLQPRYSIEEEIRINCTSDASLPAADVMWYVNEIEASFLNLEGFSSSPPDHLGLVKRSQGLRLVAERALFQSGSLRLRCLSTLPSFVVGGPHRRQTIGVTFLQSPAFLDKLPWLGSSGAKLSQSRMATFVQLLFYSYYFNIN